MENKKSKKKKLRVLLYHYFLKVLIRVENKTLFPWWLVTTMALYFHTVEQFAVFQVFLESQVGLEAELWGQLKASRGRRKGIKHFSYLHSLMHLQSAQVKR